jgi:translation initiation factor 1 (eIF-1/SUI1)
MGRRRTGKDSRVVGKVKDWIIELQGDHREVVVAEMRRLGFEVSMAGGCVLG